MEWPPKFVTHKEYMNQLMEACNTHPDFEQWLISNFHFIGKSSTTASITLPILNIDINNQGNLSVEDLKKQYFNEMNRLIHAKILRCAALDLLIKNLKYTQDDIDNENLYNCRKIKYAENKDLIARGLLKENIPMFNMPSKMKYKRDLLELFDKTIKDYTETINKITSTN
tara:strand:+ start:5311 stop:5820 length:510 start_codon:yes stop_codon:yes gene_type:complete